MAGVRRRRQARDDDEGLTESLLEEDYEDQEKRPQQEVPPLSPRRNAMIVHPGEFNLHVFLQYILSWWTNLIGRIASYAGAVMPSLAAEPTLSLIQADRLDELRERVAVRFDISSVEHQDALKRLWDLAFPGLPCTALKTPQWKEMGWQGDDPATDFRGAGLYGLQNLIFLGQEYPGVFRSLLDKTDGERAAWEYPFAVAGLNLTFMLSDVLELHAPQPSSRQPAASSAGVPRTAAARGFLALLTEDPNAFEQLYCHSFQRLDATWLAMRASYMEFNAVLKRLRADVEAALAGRPGSMEELRTKLAGPL